MPNSWCIDPWGNCCNILLVQLINSDLQASWLEAIIPMCHSIVWDSWVETLMHFTQKIWCLEAYPMSLYWLSSSKEVYLLTWLLWRCFFVALDDSLPVMFTNYTRQVGDALVMTCPRIHSIPEAEYEWMLGEQRLLPPPERYMIDSQGEIRSMSPGIAPHGPELLTASTESSVERLTFSINLYGEFRTYDRTYLWYP